jgi:eukaryotic-like serine/threonine-protein kinase
MSDSPRRPVPDEEATRILEDEPERTVKKRRQVRIGGYRLIRELGAGGMGKVFLAEQTEPVQRKVALKLIGGKRGDSLYSALFDVERQTLARLHHPYIAQVYEAGTGPGKMPWFAMELVQGEPITRHCHSHDLSLEQRLRLFVRVCQGVQHAHHRGIIHRDLKPANIMVSLVDGVSIPKVIDFGVATSLREHKDGKAHRPMQVGTPAYMSPEQQSNRPGSVSIGSDVYALGVILFELLVEKRPPRSSAESQLRLLCRSLEHRRLTASSLPPEARSSDAGQDAPLIDLVDKARHLPYELRCIVAKALAFDVDHRYQSADALGTDLESFLRDEPISAVDHTRRYLVRKFFRRHRLATTFAVLVSVSLVAGFGLAVWGWMEASTQRDIARVEMERSDMALDFVTEMLQSIDPDFAASGDLMVMQELLATAARRAGDVLIDHPDIEAEIQGIIGATYVALNDYDRAETHLQRSLALSRQESLEWQMLQAKRSLALLYQNQRDFERSEALYDRILDQRRLLADHHHQYFDIRVQLGALYADTGRPELARETIEPVMEAIRTDHSGEMIGVQLSGLSALARAYSTQGELDRAEATYLEQEALARDWDSPMARRHLSDGLNGRAIVYMEQQRPADAEPLLRESLSLTRQRLGDDHPLTLPALSNLGSSLRQQGKLDQAREVIEIAYEISRRHHGRTAYSTVLIRYNLGNLLREAEAYREALEIHQWVVSTAQSEPASQDNLPIYRTGLGQTLLAAGDDYRAVEVLEVAVQDLEQSFGPEHRRTLEAVESLLEALDSLGRGEDSAFWRERYDQYL